MDLIQVNILALDQPGVATSRRGQSRERFLRISNRSIICSMLIRSPSFSGWSASISWLISIIPRIQSGSPQNLRSRLRSLSPATPYSIKFARKRSLRVGFTPINSRRMSATAMESSANDTQSGPGACAECLFGTATFVGARRKLKLKNEFGSAAQAATIAIQRSRDHAIQNPTLGSSKRHREFRRLFS